MAPSSASLVSERKRLKNIKRGIQLLKQSKGRMNLGIAFPVAKRIVETLRQKTGSEKIQWAGSLRRMKENIGDIDILATGPNHEKIIHAFTHLPEVKEILASGETKASIIVEEGVQIDLRVVEEDSYGAALQYFTGSKAHNIHLRGIAKAKGIKINEYGVFKGEKKIGGGKKRMSIGPLGWLGLSQNFGRIGERLKRPRPDPFQNWSRNLRLKETFMSTQRGAMAPPLSRRLPRWPRKGVTNI